MRSRPMAWYLQQLIRYAPMICLIHAVLWGVVNASSLLTGIFISRMISDIESGNTSGAMEIVLAFGLLAILQAGIWLLAGRTEIAMRFRMSGVVRRNLLRMLLVIPGRAALTRSVGDTISRFRDDAYLAEDALDWTDEIIVRAIIACGALGVMLRIDDKLTLVTVVPTLAIIAGARLAGKRLAALRRASSEATSRFTSTIGDVIGAAMTIQAAGAADRTVDHIAELAHSRRSAVLKDRVVTQGVEGITRNASAIGTGLVMLMAASRIRNGDLSIADFILFTAWFAIIADVAVDVGNYLAQMSAARVAFDRMEAISRGAPSSMTIVDHTPLHLTGPLPSDDHVVPVSRDIDHIFSVSISGTSFTLSNRDVTVITGRIGSGKTSVLQSLLGLDPAGNADLTMDGKPLTESDAAIGYVPQVPRLFSGTIRENILLGRMENANALAEAVTLARLDRDIDGFVDGLDTVVGTRGTRVSGGQAQRIALGRALITWPTLLVVDDLSSALDVETEKDVWRGLTSRPNLTVLAVSHRRFVIEQADQIVVMRSGTIEAIGSLEHVLNASSEMRDMWAHPEVDTMEE